MCCGAVFRDVFVVSIVAGGESRGISCGHVCAGARAFHLSLWRIETMGALCDLFLAIVVSERRNRVTGFPARRIFFHFGFRIADFRLENFAKPISGLFENCAARADGVCGVVASLVWVDGICDYSAV